VNLRRRTLSSWQSVQSLRKTGLYDFHITNGGKMVPFAGYQMPLAYGNVGQGAGTIVFERASHESFYFF